MPKPWTVKDFLEWEAQQPERYEYIDGRILGMVGGLAAHATIKGSVFAAPRAGLQGGPCRVFVERLKVVTDVASHCPDVVVTCVPVQPGDGRVTEPVVVVEVLSRTTADRDRSAKWATRTSPRSSTTCWSPRTSAGSSCSPGPARAGT